MMAILPRRSHGGENLAGTFCQKKVDRDNCFVSRKVLAYVEINPGVMARCKYVVDSDSEMGDIYVQKSFTYFKWLSVKSKILQASVFPLRNLAQNLARNLARKSCDRTGLRLFTPLFPQ